MVTAFKNPKYLSDIRRASRPLKVNCNAGAIVAEEVGTFGSLEVWNMPEGIANIFSMPELEKKYRITYDSWEGYYIVHTERGQVRFNKDEQGLPYIDLNNSSAKAATELIQTVRGNYEGYTKKEVLQAKEARRGQGMIGSPSESDYKAMVSSNLIRNCDISPHDVSNARNMFGPQLEGIRGKTTRSKPDTVVEQYVAVPWDFVMRNKIITLSADVFFVDGIAFLLTLSRRIQFITVEHTPRRTAKQLVIHLKRVLQVYNRAGFTVRYVIMDGEFEKVKN